MAGSELRRGGGPPEGRFGRGDVANPILRAGGAAKMPASSQPRRSLPDALPTKARYVVIGAGIHGLSTAYHLARR